MSGPLSARIPGRGTTGDILRLLQRRRSILLGVNRLQHGRHLAALSARHLPEHIVVEVHHAALPRRLREDLAQRLHQPGRNATALATGRDAAGMAVVREACANFAKAQELGLQFNDGDRMKYATALFLAGDEPRAIATGQPIQNPRERTVLAQRVNYFYTIRGKAEHGWQVQAQLNQPAQTALQVPSLPSNTVTQPSPWMKWQQEHTMQ